MKMNTPLKYLILFVLLGATYSAVEFIYRLITDFSSISLIQTVVMGIIGGISAVIVGYINEPQKRRNIKITIQAIFAALIILFVEFVGGLIVNVWLGLDIWNYDGYPFNIMGQVCLPFGIAWLLIAPFNIWLDDHLRDKIFHEETTKSLGNYYKRFFTFG